MLSQEYQAVKRIRAELDSLLTSCTVRGEVAAAAVLSGASVALSELVPDELFPDLKPSSWIDDA